VFSRGTAYPDPCVIAEGRAGQFVGLCNDPAAARGIDRGMKLGAARALAANLIVLERHPDTEAQALSAVAAWAGRFSSLVSLSPPDAVLVEIAGSLKLFGSVEAVLCQVRDGIADLGYSASIAVSPRPLASRVLALACAEQPTTIAILEPEKLMSHLSRLSLVHLELETKAYTTLRGMGVRSIGDCLRLPRDGLAKRFGPGLMTRLDRLTGKLADPQSPYVAPARFKSRIELPAEVESVEALLFALHRLLLELGGFLQARSAGVQQLQLKLLHRESQTRVTLSLLAPGRDVLKLDMLMRERMERLVLPAPVLEIELKARRIVPLQQWTTDLFGVVDEGDDLQSLLERLRARLGDESVQGIYPVPEHRPERAWRYGAPGEASDAATDRERPLWLLPQPIPLQQRAGRPWLHGALSLQPDRERIESGWWDGHDLRRDYFIALDRFQARYWIYRLLDEVDAQNGKSWFLHGIFE